MKITNKRDSYIISVELSEDEASEIVSALDTMTNHSDAVQRFFDLLSNKPKVENKPTTEPCMYKPNIGRTACGLPPDHFIHHNTNAFHYHYYFRE